MSNATVGFIDKHSVHSCHGLWTPPQHVLFQVAHVALLISYMSPPGVYGVIFLHSTLILVFVLLCIWAWIMVCAPDIFGWNVAFTVINSVQVAGMVWRVWPVKFTAELEEMFRVVFKPMNVPRYLFKKLTSKQYCTILTLHQGESYARQEITRTDRLGLLINGYASVLTNGQILHHIYEKQFFDSPEFESTEHGDDRFHVSIVAEMPCRYIFWQRQALEHLFAKEPYLATVMQTLIGRDITNKLHNLNEKVHHAAGGRVDIRLPSVTAAQKAGSRSDIRTMSVSSQGKPPLAAHEPAVDEEVFDEEPATEKTQMVPNANGQAMEMKKLKKDEK